MADTKISALAAATAAGGVEIGVNDGGASKKLALSDLKTYIHTAPVFAAGSASANTWPKMTPGTLLTTAEDGALEMDATNLYGTVDAGNRGLLTIQHIIRANATRTFTSNTNAQNIFAPGAGPTNGRITLETGIYHFRGQFWFTAMSASNGNLAMDILGGGSATTTQWNWMTQALDSTADTAGTLTSARAAVKNIGAVGVAGTGTGLTLWVEGTVEVSGAGTLQPQVTMQTGATMVLGIGSWFMIERIGASGLVSVGQWD